MIFVPGNEVPHFIRGVKTQVFHGLAGEKKIDLKADRSGDFNAVFLSMAETSGAQVFPHWYF